MAEINEVIASLPRPVKIFIGGILAMQALAFVTWMVMMMREGSTKKDKDKQS